MRELLRELNDSIRAGRPVMYCRLVETRGSTPQKAGAAMLVFEDGTQRGTLGGGCVEAEVKRRALKNLRSGDAEILTFQLDSDYGWDDGLICGGRMQILVDPVREPQAAAYFEKLAELIKSGQGCIEAVTFDEEKAAAFRRSVLPSAQDDASPTELHSVQKPLDEKERTDGSAIRPTACYLFDADDRPVASLRGTSTDDAPPPVVGENLVPLAVRPRAYAKFGVSFLPVLPRCRLLIVGGGHVGQAVGNMAADMDFDVWVVDDRESFASRERFPRAERLIAGPVDQVLPEVEITPDTYCLVVTRGHNHDEEALYHLIDRGARYVGMIGSKRKIKLIFDDLRNEGVSAESLSRVFAPVGIDIGSQTVPEIAVSILAELIAHRNLGGKVPGRPERETAVVVDGSES